MDYLVSTVIPTKNRQKYCIRAIEQILGLQDESIQIVVQDNSDDDAVEKYVEKKNASSIAYRHVRGIISFVDNFSVAMQLVKGKYVCFIGDDDGVLPVIMQVARYAEQHCLDAVIPSLGAVYFWPNSRPIVKHGENGYLSLSFIEGTIKKVNCKKALAELMNSAAQDYQTLSLVRCYHGLVLKSRMDEVYNRLGYYFGGLTPDIYMAVAASILCENSAQLSFPITVSGICSGSGSADSATGAHTGRLEDAPHFRGHDDYCWSSKVPAFYSVETIWADTALHALADFGQKELMDSFNVAYLNSLCLNKYPQYREFIDQNALRNHAQIANLRMFALSQKVKRQSGRVYKSLRHGITAVKKYYGVQDIENAVAITAEYMKQKKIVL